MFVARDIRSDAVADIKHRLATFIEPEPPLNARNGRHVLFGMFRFVTGQYSTAVRHGGMMGYALDGDISRAMTNVDANMESISVAAREHKPQDPITFAFSAHIR
jgi:hypothetical protein